MTTPALANEWNVLQNQSDSYEKYSLIIKLIAIILAAITLSFDHDNIIIIALLLTLWLQDAIWKTFQARINTRLLEVEAALADSESTPLQAYQLNQQYLINRPSSIGLIKEYIRQAIKPTVAFPYSVLIVLAFISISCQNI
jgi:hypothetical protein